MSSPAVTVTLSCLCESSCVDFHRDIQWLRILTFFVEWCHINVVAKIIQIFLSWFLQSVILIYLSVWRLDSMSIDGAKLFKPDGLSLYGECCLCVLHGDWEVFSSSGENCLWCTRYMDGCYRWKDGSFSIELCFHLCQNSVTPMHVVSSWTLLSSYACLSTHQCYTVFNKWFLNPSASASSLAIL